MAFVVSRKLIPITPIIFFQLRSIMICLPAGARLIFSARELDIELDPRFIFYPDSASRHFYRLDIEIRLLHTCCPYEMAVRFPHIHDDGLGLTVESQISLYPPGTGADRLHLGRSKHNFGV